MLNRLIIAVFGIALVLAFGSTALAGPDLDQAQDVAVTKFIPNHPKLAELPNQDIRPEQPSFKKPASALRALPPGTQSPGTPSLVYFCDAQTYAGGPFYFWTIPDAFGDDLFNTRFTVEDNFDCTLKVAHLLMYEPGFAGAGDMRVYLWDDDGFGFPGAVLDSVDIPNATILAATGGGLGYVSADFSASGWVFSDGAEYHYGWTPIGGAGDTLAIISDDGFGPASGEERSSEFYLGAWGSMLNDWGLDVVFDIVSERCCSEIPFSDCYVQAYAQNLAFFWRAPHPIYGDSAYSMRFDVGGPETLVSVDLFIFDHTGITGELAGDNDVYVTVYDDDGTGFPGVELARVTLPAFSYPFFPALTTVSFAPLVLENTFHVAFSSNGIPGVSYESCLSSDGTDGTGRSNGSGDPGWPGPTTWYTMLSWWGGDFNFIIETFQCRDEFSACDVQNYAPITDAIYPVPDGNPIIEWAQKFTATGGAECELRELTVCFARSGGFDVGNPARDSMYTKNTLVHVKEDLAGIPGATLHTEVLTPADYAAAGYTGAGYAGEFYITIPGLNVVVPPNYWVTVEPLAVVRDTGIRVCLNIAGGGGLNDGLFANAPAFGGWLDIASIFGWAEDAGMNVSAKVCCVPFSGRVCSPPDDWSAGSHDLGRTAASQLAIEDAWCDLNVDWYYETPANTIQFNAPVVYDGRVFVSTSDGVGAGSTVEVFDLYDGTQLGTFSGVEFNNFLLNDPLIVDDVMYIAGGDNRTISAWDVSTWTVPGAPLWTRTLGGAVGPTRSSHLLLLDVGGTDVLFGGSQTGRVFALNASDGLDYPGWASNPIVLDAGQLVRNSASDGSQLFFTTYIAGLDGDVWSIDPATGTTNWKLSTSGGRQGTVVYASATAESFASLSYEGGVVYAGSRVSGNFPADGVFYRIVSGTGALVGAASASNGFFSSTFVTDVNLVYALTITRWVGGSVGYPLLAFSKSSGALVWEQEHIMETAHEGGYLGNGALSCEPEPVPDILVTTEGAGLLNFWNSITGEQMFRRRWDFGPGSLSDGTSASIGTDSSGAVHVLATSLFGGVVSMAKGADRPRLEIQDYDPTLAVEFSVATSDIKTVPNNFVNTGCADLTFNAVNVDDATFGSTDPLIVSVRPGLWEITNTISDNLAANSAFHKNVQENLFNADAAANTVSTVREQSYRNERTNRAATAYPVYLNGVVEPFAGQVVAGGDSSDLVLDVNPSLIERGPQTFYIELDTDDPDFFLNGASAFLPNAFPELIITLVGGCLTDTTALEFGAGGANYQWVTNSTRMGTGDWSPHAFDIDGNTNHYYQGGYVFGVSTERIAFNSQDWSGGGGEDNAWISVQADPNYCDNDCKPALSTGVGLGAMWDGASYVPIVGNMVCASWIDSVQNFSNDPDTVDVNSWDWKNWGAPFNDSLTMGLSANTRTFGVPDVPEFSQLTLEIFDVTERNGDSVAGWRFGYNVDYDAAPIEDGSADTAVYDQANSAAWTTSSSNPSGSDFAWGLVKLPFGCGYTPLVNARALDAGQGHFIGAGGAARGDGYMDSAYYYMGLPFGSETSQSLSGSPDQQFHATIATHDFGPSETYSFAVVNFAFGSPGPGVSDPSAPGGGGEIAALAHLTNKWVGFGRGDVNDDNAINLGDIMTLAAIVNGSVPGAIPFEHLGDVDTDGDVDNADLQYMIDYYFQCGPCPLGAWEL